MRKLDGNTAAFGVSGYQIALAIWLALAATGAWAADNVTGNLITFDNDGMWSWYMDERVIVDPTNGTLLIGSITSSPVTYPAGRPTGGIDLVTYKLATGSRSRFQLSDIQEDDHNAPGLLILPDGRYLALYSNHGNNGGLGDEFTRWRKSVNPGDTTAWTTEQLFNWFDAVPGANQTGNPDAANVSYHNLFYLSEENQVYNISRSYGRLSINGASQNMPNILRYDMDTNTVEWAGQLLESEAQGYSAYPKYASNGVDRIYFTTTETHPRNYNNSIWAGYIESGQTFDMLGNLVDADIFDNGTADGGSGFVPDVTDFSVVQQAEPLGAGYNRLWTVDMALDGSQNPVAMYVSRYDTDGSDPGNQQNSDHRIHYARWDGTQWNSHEIARMGGHLYGSEEDYTGNGALVPGDPNTLYISTQYDPRDATGATVSTFREIYKGVTANGGANWSWTPITSGSTSHNLRPLVPKWDEDHTAVVWFKGTYTSAQSTDAAVVGIIEQNDTETGLVHYVDATTSNTTRATGAALAATGPSSAEGVVDSNWHWRTGSGNGSDVLASGGSGSENAPAIRTTLSGLADGSYDVFAYFWANPAQDWRIQAGFAADDLQLVRDNGAQQAEASQFDPLDPSVVLTGASSSALYRFFVGRTDVTDSSAIDVFLDDFSANTTTRAWYDGLGYALVSDVIQGLAGDFNGDMIVDAADYTLWRDNLGAADDSIINDNGDGVPGIDQADYDVWKANFGSTSPGAGGASSSVPEPSAGMLLCLAALPFLGHWRSLGEARRSTRARLAAWLSTDEERTA